MSQTKIGQIMMENLKLIAALALSLGVLFSGTVAAQELDKLPNYVAVLPQVKARALAVHPQKGYLVEQLKRGAFVISAGAYQSPSVTTGNGLIRSAAPPS